MDASPTVAELLEHVQLPSNTKINKLAKRLGIYVEYNIKGKDRLETVFRKWIAEGDEATRVNMVNSLLAINEDEAADTYLNHIESIEESTNDLSSIFKNVQKEDVMVDMCVMQCMPLGPPRVGKTCLKKRLLQEDLGTNHSSPSTPIVEEKQTVIIESPNILTLDAKSTNWKLIPWESEVFHLIQKFKNAPQSLLNSIQSLDQQKTWILNVLALALLLLFQSLYVQQWLMLFFAFVSFIIALMEIDIIPANKLILSILHIFQLIALLSSFPAKKYNIVLLLLVFYKIVRLYLFPGLLAGGFVYFTCFLSFIYYKDYLVDFHQSYILGISLLCGIDIKVFYSLIAFQVIVYGVGNSYVIFVEIMKGIFVFSTLWDKEGVLNFEGYYNFSVAMIWTDIYTVLVFLVLYLLDNKRVIDRNDESNSEIVRRALNKMPNVSKFTETLDGSLKIYFTDSGGQPEFQEVLPALLSGPTVFFLVFDLSKPFDVKYEVEYVDSDCSQFKPYQTQYTVMDTLLQCLASISCLGEYSKTPNSKNIGIKPKVFFIGTHKDLVSEAILLKREKELDAAIKKTAWYKKDMIEFASGENLIFSVNNFDQNDSSFVDVRTAIEKLSQFAGYKIKIKAQWLGLELSLRAHNDSVISISECERIAEECSITNTEDVKEALWFLHNKVGSIRHYQQIPELNDVVITKPQLLFTIVTDLLVSTFPRATGKINSTFQEKGRFTRDDLQEIGKIDKTGLTVTQVIALLCYLHILAPLKQDKRGNRDYFLPCVLSHAPKRTTQSNDNILLPALLIGFKCGYTPKGVFGALISYLLQNTHAGIEWLLDEERIFRDQATFMIGKTGYSLIITYLPKYLRLELCEPQSSGEYVDARKHRRIRKIMKCFLTGLEVVCKRLNYTCETEPLFGFYCSCSTSEKGHPAYSLSKRNDILTCNENPSKTFRVSIEQNIWLSNYLPIYLEIVLSIWHFFLKIPKMCGKVIFFLFKYMSISGVVVLLIALVYGLMNSPDLHQLNRNYSGVKTAQISHYAMLCDHSKSPDSLPCRLMNMTISSSANVNPIRLWLNQKKHDSNFIHMQYNCSFAIIASFDNCYPKDCRFPFRQIQNGFSNYLTACPLSIDICWPIIDHIIEVHSWNILILLPSIIATNIAGFRSLSKAWMFYVYYALGDSHCTEDIIDELDSLQFEDFLSILKFVQYTRLDLSPSLILHSIDKAVSVNETRNFELIEMFKVMSKKASSNNWLIPIIATSTKRKWLQSNKLMKEYFPVNITLG